MIGNAFPDMYVFVDKNDEDDILTADVAIVPDDYFTEDEDPELDARIFFYFTETEFAQAQQHQPIEGIEFDVVRIHDDIDPDTK